MSWTKHCATVALNDALEYFKIRKIVEIPTILQECPLISDALNGTDLKIEVLENALNVHGLGLINLTESNESEFDFFLGFTNLQDRPHFFTQSRDESLPFHWYENDCNLNFFGVTKCEDITTASWNLPIWGGAKRPRVTKS